MNTKEVYDVMIIGGGPAGCTAGLYCARGGLKTVVLERLAAGGQMCLTEKIDNYPALPDGIDGITLGAEMRRGAEKFGAEIRSTEVHSVKLGGEIKSAETDSGTIYSKTVIIAAGAECRKLGIEGEEELTGRGVSYCALCDGMFYKGRTVVVVGGGESAAAEALHLSKLCSRVIIVHRKKEMRASRSSREALGKTSNIEFCLGCEVTSVNGSDKLGSITVRDTESGSEREITCDGLFISIGRVPSTAIFKGQVYLDEKGYIAADETTKTTTEGVFAAGDIRTKRVRQIITAAADGASAAYFACEYLGVS